MTQSSEADARLIIDENLRAAGWDLTDRFQVRTEVTIKDVKSGPAAASEPGGRVQR